MGNAVEKQIELLRSVNLTSSIGAGSSIMKFPFQRVFFFYLSLN